jgi:hypothetical protein
MAIIERKAEWSQVADSDELQVSTRSGHSPNVNLSQRRDGRIPSRWIAEV